MSKNNSDLENKNPQVPSSFPQNTSGEFIANLQLISEVFQKIEEETAEMAELIFDYLINASDEQIMNGTIPECDYEHIDIIKKKRINDYLKILNRLFLFSRKSKESGIRIINRRTVEELDKKTFVICMCYDGGVSLDILCDIVNTENQARTPTISPVKVTVKQAFGMSVDNQRF